MGFPSGKVQEKQEKEVKDGLITEQSLLDFGFYRKTSNHYSNLITKFVTIWYNSQTKEVKIYDDKNGNTITLDTLFFKNSESSSIFVG